MKVYAPTTRDVEDPPPSKFKVTLIQVLLALGTSLTMVSPGMALGFSAVALPQLRNETSFEPLTEEQSSWFASISNIATPVGCLLSGWMLDKWGRRITLMVLNVPGIIGWVMIAVAQGLVPLFIGRILTGFCLGMASASSNVYLGEVTQPKLRGALMCWNSISIAAGILIIYILGSALPWRYAAVAGAVPAVLSLVSTFFMFESTSWLLGKSRHADAERALVKLRGGGGPEVRQELDDLVRAEEQRARGKQSTGLSQISRNFRKPQFWKPLLIINVFFAFQQFAGIYVVIFYAVDVVAEAGVSIDKYLATILIGVARLVVTACVSVAMRRCGRRPLGLISGVGMTVSMLVLAGHLFFTHDMEEVPLSWLPTVCILGYIVVSTIGFLTLPWAMLGELFPADLRGLGGGLTTCCAYLIGFAVLKAYPGMQENLHSHGTFFVYGIMSLLGTIFVGLWLPETAGRSLAEVEASFTGKPLNKSNKEAKQLLEVPISTITSVK